MSDHPQQANTPNTAPRPKSRQRNLRQLSSIQITIAILLTIGLMLAVQFSTRIAQDRDLQQMEQTVRQEIELLQAAQEDLIEELSFVQSDAYVEGWAHGEGRMVREGEVLVIPIPSAVGNPPEAATAVMAQQGVIETSLPEPDEWHLWWALFFDTAPPQLNG